MREKDFKQLEQAILARLPNIWTIPENVEKLYRAMWFLNLVRQDYVLWELVVSRRPLLADSPPEKAELLDYGEGLFLPYWWKEHSVVQVFAVKYSVLDRHNPEEIERLWGTFGGPQIVLVVHGICQDNGNWRWQPGDEPFVEGMYAIARQYQDEMCKSE